MSENQDLAPVIESDGPIVQEQEDEEEHVADTEKPKKQTQPYIMTEDGKQCHRGVKSPLDFRLALVF